jgi:hypothetical protein
MRAVVNFSNDLSGGMIDGDGFQENCIYPPQMNESIVSFNSCSSNPESIRMHWSMKS